MTTIDGYALTADGRAALAAAQTQLAAARDGLAFLRGEVAWEAEAARAFQDAASTQWQSASSLADLCGAAASALLARGLQFAERALAES